MSEKFEKGERLVRALEKVAEALGFDYLASVKVVRSGKLFINIDFVEVSP
jgi:hypothetical protein